MNASQAKTGCKYISRTGMPVTVIGNKNGKVSLKLAATDSVIRVNSDYELKSIDSSNSSHDPNPAVKRPERPILGHKSPYPWHLS